MEISSNFSSEMTAEFVLSHVIDNICRFLKIRDLCSVAKVNRLWQDAALREMRRRGPKVGEVPYFEEPMYRNCDSNLLDLMDTKPCIAVLFFNRTHYRHTLDEKVLPYVINTYKQHLECNVAALNSEETYFYTSARADAAQVLSQESIPSLFLPVFKQSNLVISCCRKKDGISSAIFAQRMYKELVSDYKDSRITLILFTVTQRGINIATKLCTMIKTNHEQKEYSIWGNDCYTLQTVDYDPSNCQNIIEPDLMGIRIYGPNIDSLSFTLDANLKPDKFEEQLLKFKENVKLKHHSLGLTCGPLLLSKRRETFNEEVQDSCLIMKLIKKVFPDIDFIGKFNYEFYSTVYGCDSTSDTSNVDVAIDRVAIMIITYD